MRLPAFVPEPGSWRWDAVCAQIDGDMWHPEKGDKGNEAKKICLSCRVKSECLEEALANYEYGIWGGTSWTQRTKIRRQRRSGQ